MRIVIGVGTALLALALIAGGDAVMRARYALRVFFSDEKDGIETALKEENAVLRARADACAPPAELRGLKLEE